MISRNPGRRTGQGICERLVIRNSLGLFFRKFKTLLNRTHCIEIFIDLAIIGQAGPTLKRLRLLENKVQNTPIHESLTRATKQFIKNSPRPGLAGSRDIASRPRKAIAWQTPGKTPFACRAQFQRRQGRRVTQVLRHELVNGRRSHIILTMIIRATSQPGCGSRSVTIPSRSPKIFGDHEI